MSTSMIPLFSGDAKFITHMHVYKDDNPDQDLVLIANMQGILSYYLLDRIKVSIVKRKPFPYISKVSNLLKEHYPYVSIQNTELLKVMGLFDKTTNPVPTATIFLIMHNKMYDVNFIVQVNILNHNVQNAEYILVDKYRESKNQYMDLLVKENVLITDTQKIADYHSYIMFINTQGNGKIGGCYVEGLRIMVSNEEKLEFKQNFPSIDLPHTLFPIVDVWADRNAKFVQLPHNTVQTSFSFSTGLGYLKFEGEE